MQGILTLRQNPIPQLPLNVRCFWDINPTPQLQLIVRSFWDTIQSHSCHQMQGIFDSETESNPTAASKCKVFLRQSNLTAPTNCKEFLRQNPIPQLPPNVMSFSDKIQVHSCPQIIKICPRQNTIPQLPQNANHMSLISDERIHSDSSWHQISGIF